MKDIKDWNGDSIPPVAFGEHAFIHQLTTLQRANAHMNKAAYQQVKAIVTERRSVAPALNIIIPVKGRSNHLKASLASLNASIKLLPPEAMGLVSITIAEMDSEPHHEKIAFEQADYYTFIKGDMFNKSFLMNSAAILFATDVFLFYDVDLIVEDTFIPELMAYAYTLFKQEKTSWVLQPIYERKIFYIHEDLTNKIFDGTVSVKNIRDEKFMNDVYVQPTWYDNNFPPGGAIMVTKDLFHTVGGYDPELFWGYSPEDRLFLQNCVALSGGEFHIASNPKIGRMYHLYHPNSETTNFMYEHMVTIEQMLAAHPAARTCYLVNKHILGTVPSGSGWPDLQMCFNDASLWASDSGLSAIGQASVESMTSCKQKLVSMMCQWWHLVPASSAEKNVLRLEFLPDAIAKDPRIPRTRS